jgi:hypothetical protein
MVCWGILFILKPPLKIVYTILKKKSSEAVYWNQTGNNFNALLVLDGVGPSKLECHTYMVIAQKNKIKKK